MSVILPYLFILSTSYSLCRLFNKPFNKVIVLSFLIPTLFLYLGGLIENIKLGLILSLLFSLVWVIYLIKDIKNKSFNYKKLLDPSIVVFTILFIAISMYFRQAFFNQWDEFTHWGPMVKEMYRLNKFYCVSDSYLRVHKDYPPFTSLLELLWCYLSRGYMERNCMRAITIFASSFIFPITSYFKDNNKNFLKYIFSTILFSLLFIINFKDGLETLLITIYPDALNSLLFAYIMFELIQTDKYDCYSYLLICLLLTSLILIKQVNLAFYMMAIVFVIIKFIMNKQDKKVYIKILIFYIAIPMIIYKTWNLYINIHNYYVFRQFELDMPSILDALNTMTGKVTEEYKVTTFNNYISALFNKQLLNFNITFFPICIIIGICLFFVIKNNKSNKEAILTTSIYTIGVIGYAVMMCILYLTSFSEYEATNLASYERYMETYVYFSIALLVYLIISFYLDKLNKKSIIICSLTTLTLLSLSLGGFDKYIIRKIENSYRNDEKYLNMFNELDAYITSDDNVLVINQYNDSNIDLYLKYEYLGHSIDSVVVSGISYEEWRDKYSGYDYIYTFITTEDFYNNYWLEKQELPLLNNRLYKVNEDGTLELMDWNVVEFN